ncbi:hypothetical protein Y032_0497g2500 [Ancylostoma ceylanicum]|uniref:Uncharacterized protein n=1 Tax=Ancylostoma ceylanicum TaxID=53326 RepID=A0A016WUH4_9BILA|nr:hypothetical protein Y032_0497g2500 [Ancylostoma ceylanicum]
MKARLASRHRSEPLKNGIWHYVQYVERFTLIAMSSRKRVTFDDAIGSAEILLPWFQRMHDAHVSVGVRQSLAKAIIALYKFIEDELEARLRNPRRNELKIGKIRLHKVLEQLKTLEKENERLETIPTLKVRIQYGRRTPRKEQYFVLDAKSKRWVYNCAELRDFVIEKERWENMYDAAASFFLRFKGERVDYVSVSHFLKQLPRDCGYRALKISFNTTEHGAAALHFDDFHEKKIAKLVGADPNCAMLACKPY